MSFVDLCSDIHLGFLRRAESKDPAFSASEYLKDIFETAKADTLLIGGDICENLGEEDPLASFFFQLAQERYKNIFCVLGNHDYWSSSRFYPQVLKGVRERYPGIRFLENETAELPDFKIFGATFWSFISPPNEAAIIGSLNDFWNIRVSEEQGLIPDFLNQKNEESLRKLKNFIAEPSAKKKVVLTHHAPSARANTRYPNSVLEEAFCNYLDPLIEASDLSLWCYGHIHNAEEFKIGKTRVISNPHGNFSLERTLQTPYSFKTIEI